MNKIIAVEFLLGRCGTSMIMGLLHRAGVNTGPNDHREPDIMNPGGYFEAERKIQLVHGDMANLTGFNMEFVDYDERKKEVERYRGRFLGIVNNDYHGKYPMAIKDMSATLLPMMDGFDVRVVYATRNLKDQVDSIFDMWEKIGVNGPPREKVEEFLILKRPWMNEMLRKSNKPVFEVDFNDVLDNPVSVARDVCDFCEVRRIPVKTVLSWVCPKYSRSRS